MAPPRLCFLACSMLWMMVRNDATVHVDPDTPAAALTTTRRMDGKVLDLVMSDEFTQDGRSFAAGDDDVFEAIDQPDNVNQAMEFYNSSTEYVTTENGSLVLTTRAVKTHWVGWCPEAFRPIVYTKNYTSSMVQTWNKFCFTGGVLELSIKLPGHAYSGGLWPAAWLVGNLARATYQKSTLGVWPWSYDKCGEVEYLQFKQQISACDGNPGYGLHPFQGRGAPEIDIFEVMPGHEMPGSAQPIRPFISQSLQVSPGIPKEMNRPMNGDKLNRSVSTWYTDVTMSPGGEFNDGFWGAEAGGEYDPTKQQIHKYMEDAISVNTYLEESHFESHHVYRLEWQPGAEGKLAWYIDDKFYMAIGGQSMQELTGAKVPEEPMYLVLNTAISHQWGFPEPCDREHCSACWQCYDCTNPDCQCALPDGMKNCKNLPAKMEIDYMRLYQDRDDPSHTVGCSPERFPTAEFIEAHPERYASWAPYQGAIPLGSSVFSIMVTWVSAAAAAAAVAVLAVRYRQYYHRGDDGDDDEEEGAAVTDGHGGRHIVLGPLLAPSRPHHPQPVAYHRASIEHDDDGEGGDEERKYEPQPQPRPATRVASGGRVTRRNPGGAISVSPAFETMEVAGQPGPPSRRGSRVSATAGYGATADDGLVKATPPEADASWLPMLPKLFREKVDGLLMRTGLGGPDSSSGVARRSSRSDLLRGGDDDKVGDKKALGKALVELSAAPRTYNVR